MQSYPSPSAAPADSQPFYASSSSQQQSEMRDADELQLTAQLSRGLAPIMSSAPVPGGGIVEVQGQRTQSQGNVNHSYEHDQEQHSHASHIPPSQSPLGQMGGQYGQPEGSMAPRKRSKVSRACDECRRKKIRCDATGEPGDDQCSSCKRVSATCRFSRVPMKRGPSKGYIKELADRLNHLEGAMQAGEIPVSQYLSHHESPMQRRPSEEYSPPPHGENSRKRTYSSVSGEFASPYLPQRSQVAWSSVPEPPRHLPPSTTFSPPQGNAVFRDSTYSPNGIQPLPQWRNPPELPHRHTSAFEHTPEDIGRGHVPEMDDSVLDSYFATIHPTYPILWSGKSRISSKVSNCPLMLRDAFNSVLYALTPLLPSLNLPLSREQATIKSAQLITSFQFESGSSPAFSTSLVLLQTLMLLAIKTSQARIPGRSSQSVWLGSAVGLAYTLKLHQHRPQEYMAIEDQDSDEPLARKIWWALVTMDRWHASSTSSPVLIPDGSVVLSLDDHALLGESLYQVARLSIVLGHCSAVILETSSNPQSGLSPNPFYGILLKGELDRCYESFPSSFLQTSDALLLHLCYWHLRILIATKLSDAEPFDIYIPTKHIVTQLTHNAGFSSPLTFHFTMLATLSLMELTESESTRNEATKGLQALLEKEITPSTWDAAIRAVIARKMESTSNAAKLSMAESEQAAVAAQGLQHLADLATSQDIPNTGDERKEDERPSSGSAGPRFKRKQPLREIIRDGYLNAFC